jgi:hypothetical protein
MNMMRRGVWSLCTGVLAAGLPIMAAPVKMFEQPPVAITNAAPGVMLVDFGRVAFGNLRFEPPPGVSATATMHFGEAFSDGRIERKPAGTVRYAQATAVLRGGEALVVAPSADNRNTTHPSAVHTPAEWGVVLPFRWVEIEGWPGGLQPEQITRRAAFAATWQDDAAAFNSSDPMLDRIWELCRYSIKATTFAGVYVDGDRERIPYEADAYINQLGHYACDPDPQMARDTFDYLVKKPTWPTEWAFHMIFIAHADWMQTGDRAWLAARYESLKPKLLLDRAREDGLLASPPQAVKRDDIVDWPAGERDGFVHRTVNTVVNAFHIRSLALMAELAGALGKAAEARDYGAREQRARAAFQDKLFDAARGLYRDGEETEHVSLHANLFPLAFGLVPEPARAGVAKWLAGRGMACSVYAAQYLLEGLLEHGADRDALRLILAPGDRSWRHMVESGTTITWEAWDQKYKPNQDWNHAWGAAPANLLPRFVLGARALEPGWTRALIRPHPGGLTRAAGRIPTPRGPIEIDWASTEAFRLKLSLPPGVSAKVQMPAPEGSAGVWRQGKPVAASREGAWWTLNDDVTGSAELAVR